MSWNIELKLADFVVGFVEKVYNLLVSEYFIATQRIENK